MVSKIQKYQNLYPEVLFRDILINITKISELDLGLIPLHSVSKKVITEMDPIELNQNLLAKNTMVILLLFKERISNFDFDLIKIVIIIL